MKIEILISIFHFPDLPCIPIYRALFVSPKKHGKSGADCIYNKIQDGRHFGSFSPIKCPKYKIFKIASSQICGTTYKEGI